MKKVSLILVGGAVALGSLFTSCSKDEVAPAVSTVTVGTTAITKDGDTAKVEAGTDFAIAWAVTKGDNDFKSLTVRVGTEDDTVVTDAAKITVGGYTNNFVAGVYNVKVVVADKDGLEGTRSFVIKATGTATAAAIVEYTGKVLGAQTASEGSYFDVATGTVLGQTAAATAGTSVSYSYAAVGSTPAATLIAPSARLSAGLTKTSVGAEKCYFKKSTAAAYASATATTIAALTVSATDVQQITVANGDVIEFLTSTGKKGLIQVTALTAGVDGKITISVKVQK